MRKNCIETNERINERASKRERKRATLCIYENHSLSLLFFFWPFSSSLLHSLAHILSVTRSSCRQVVFARAHFTLSPSHPSAICMSVSLWMRLPVVYVNISYFVVTLHKTNKPPICTTTIESIWFWCLDARDERKKRERERNDFKFSVWMRWCVRVQQQQQ